MTNEREELVQAIEALRRQRNAVILAHYYQEPDIQDIADELGDSLALARAAQRTRADVIVLCGVHFMAETAKILNPNKRVLLPDMEAGCSLAEGCPAEELAAWKAAHPRHVVVSYVNTSAAVKALSDYTCTSSNAEAVIRAVPPEAPILFVPDRNLGRYLMAKTGRELELWPSVCEVHESFVERHVLDLLAAHPTAELIAHPECEEALLQHATTIGSTQRLLEHVARSERSVFVVATEIGILHAMRKAAPGKTLIPAAPSEAQGGAACGCSTCPHMKRNTLTKVHACLRDLRPEIELPAALLAAARVPIERMLAIV